MRQPRHFILIDQYDAILFALIDSPAPGVATQLGLRQCSHRRGKYIMKVFSELAVHLFLHGLKLRSRARFSNSPPSSSSQLGAPADFIHSLTANQRTRAAVRQMLALRRGMQMLVIVGEGFVIVVDARQLRVGEFLPTRQRGCQARRQHQ